MRTTARATRAALTVAALAALSLSLTACDGDQGSGAGKGSAGRSTGSTDSAGSTDGTGNADGTVTPPGGSGPVAKAAGGDCTLTTAKVTLEDTGGTMPVALLKITNNGAKSCPVFGAPVVGDPTTGKNLPAAENTRPRSVVRVAPNRSAYAAVNLASTDADKTHRSKTLDVTLATKDGKATDGRVTVASPGVAGLLLDAYSQVTHWQHTSEAAMS